MKPQATQKKPPQMFPTPSDDESPMKWCFDRALEALVLVDRTGNLGPGQASINAWPRRVWEPAHFTLDALRFMPAAPPIVHGALVQDSRWR